MSLPTASILLTALLISLPTLAKLPPPTDEAKAKAAEATSRAAWSTKVAGFQLCNAINRTAAHYHARVQKAGGQAPAPIDTAACVDAGPFVPPPLESAGAHSPATTAVAPPNTKATEAEIKGSAKK